MPKQNTAQQDATVKGKQANEFAGFAHVRIPGAFLHPHTFTSKDGKTFEKAYVSMPQGVKVNGIDIGGYSCDVFLSARMKQQMLSGEQVNLSFKADEPVTIWTGKKGDAEHPYQRFEVNPWDLVKGIKANNEQYKEAKAAERAAAQEQGVSLSGEAKAQREAATALSGDAPDKGAPSKDMDK